ncbi:DUF6476 family protein [Parasulfitobacter algicola]|nr:DUF6476 family protein [Sulfitobacter algicola]
MEQAPFPEEPANLKFLRRMVNLLTIVMIAGVVIITTVFVIRFSSSVPALPDQITLPGGETASAFTQGLDWYAVVTESDKIIIFDRRTGALKQTIEIAN